VDPGYAACGVALLDGSAQRWRALVLDTIRTKSGEPLAARLHTVWKRVGEIILASQPMPAVLAVEAQARAQAGYRERGQSADTALAVREVTGLLRALAWQHGLAFVEVEPATCRACLGLPAKAPKAQVQRAVRARLSWEGRLNEHAADAGAAALAGYRHFSSYAARK
jgi:Holliday junction resolvasome RuvABC endonuclease subunit